jgi:colanic acid/amylovoran biosynthesis glycosyltransferase
MPETEPITAKPIVASYCTTFLKPEMRHIYRQVTGLRRFDTFVLTRERLNQERFPFDAIERIPRARKNFIKRFWLKYVMRRPPVYYRGELQVLIKMLRRRPADLMHIYFGHTGVHLLPFIEEWPHPCVVSFHGMDVQPRPEQPGFDAQMRLLLQTIPLVLARSQSLVDNLVALGCPREKLRLNRTGIPLEQFPFQQRTPPANRAWCFVQACRLIAKKGLRTALRAFAKFHKANPQSRFVIAGDGPMKAELQTLARELGIAEAVTLPGFLSQNDLAALFQRAHLFVHPSELTSDQNQEGVPNAMLEAMATGLPVLATTHGGIPEAVTDRQTGLLVPERDDEALFQAMRTMTDDPSIAWQYGAAAAETVRKRFELARAIEALEAIYDEALALGSRRAPHGASRSR